MIVCRMSQRLIVAHVLDTGEPPQILAGHVSQCLRCQALAASTRRLRRHLADLRPVEFEPESAGAGAKGWVAMGVASVAVAVAVSRARQGEAQTRVS